MLPVQDYLLRASLRDLERDHSVDFSLSGDCCKVSLNYNQFKAAPSNKLANTCRGLILAKSRYRSDPKTINPDEVFGYSEIVAYPFDRFFNYGEGHDGVSELDWPSVVAYEKVDGTLCIVYYDNFKHNWCVATRRVPDADLPIPGGNMTFRSLFEVGVKNTFDLTFEDFCKQFLLRRITYCFELVGPLNKVVVSYPQTKIYYLGARNIVSLKEIDQEFLNCSVPYYKFDTLENTINWVNSLDHTKNEGIVLRDKYFNRLKIKNPDYVLLNRSKDIFASDVNCLKVILEEKYDDVYPNVVKEIQKKLESIKICLKLLNRKYNIIYSKVYKSNAKEFALSLKDIEKEYDGLFLAPFFSIHKGKCKDLIDFCVKNKEKDSVLKKILDQFGDL